MDNIATMTASVDPIYTTPRCPISAYNSAYEACADSSAVLTDPYSLEAVPISPAREAGQHRDRSKHPSVAPPLSMDEEDLSEMEIMALKAQVNSNMSPDDLISLDDHSDPLNRLVEVQSCAAGCEACQASLWASTAGACLTGL
jgi:hypothetical protein